MWSPTVRGPARGPQGLAVCRPARPSHPAVLHSLLLSAETPAPQNSILLLPRILQGFLPASESQIKCIGATSVRVPFRPREESFSSESRDLLLSKFIVQELLQNFHISSAVFQLLMACTVVVGTLRNQYALLYFLLQLLPFPSMNRRRLLSLGPPTVKIPLLHFVPLITDCLSLRFNRLRVCHRHDFLLNVKSRSLLPHEERSTLILVPSCLNQTDQILCDSLRRLSCYTSVQDGIVQQGLVTLHKLSQRIRDFPCLTPTPHGLSARSLTLHGLVLLCLVQQTISLADPISQSSWDDNSIDISFQDDLHDHHQGEFLLPETFENEVKLRHQSKYENLYMKYINKLHSSRINHLTSSEDILPSSKKVTRSVTTEIRYMEGEGGPRLRKWRRFYTRWTKWTSCSPECLTHRQRKCRLKEMCGNEVLSQTAYCYTERSSCKAWIQSMMAHGWNLPDPVKSISGGESYKEQRYRAVAVERVSQGGRKECGVANSSVNWELKKIIGGRPARQGQWPWQVALINRYKQVFCGGTLISEEWVLTAAHCIQRPLYVRLGDYNLASREGTELQMRVKEMVVHPDYDADLVDSDIALLKLPMKVTRGQWIMPACLPDRSHRVDKRLCTIIGWGKTNANHHSGTHLLQQTQIPVVSRSMCKEVYRDYKITKNMVCAGYKEGRRDTCLGDSGGPLLCRDTRGSWIVYGITSFGEGCARKSRYGIYTRVPNYVSWIKRVTAAH